MHSVSLLTLTCSKSTIETLEKGVNMFKVNNKKTSDVFTVIFTYFTLIFCVSIVDFKGVNVRWVIFAIFCSLEEPIIWF